MKSVLQKAFLWCVLTTLLPSITNAKPLNTDDLRSVWLQGKVWSDVRSVLERREGDSTALLSSKKNSGTDPDVPQHRLRVRRTEPAYSVKRVERAGCNLATCSVHDLAHLLHQMSTKTNSAPPEKISSKGYGRRRRRSLPSTLPPLTFDEDRLKLAWVQTFKRCAPCWTNEGTIQESTSSYCLPMTV
ncbi:pro-adrenomedullin-like [Myxocyprinus asiaticus]|uniref:pro-adrenomedullin-like n=1 Tax=Myxocyprinus asiaticus TaxID=70543 RepID=UPI0022217565|nr:pro-adrenomedullin-like [Myxocyprinus asiaticus]